MANIRFGLFYLLVSLRPTLLICIYIYIYIQEERLQLAAKSQKEREDIRAMVVKTGVQFAGSRKTDGVDKSVLVCTHFHRRGHDETTCWSKHGYPDWWEHRAPRGRGRGSNRGGRGMRFTQSILD